MSIIMFDGFDDNLFLKNKWTAMQGVTLVAGRTGNGARLSYTPSPASQLKRSLSTTEEDDVIVLGCAVKATPLSSPSPRFLAFESDGGSTSHVYMKFTGVGTGAELRFYQDGGSPVLIGSCAFGEGIWRYLEVKIKLHDTLGFLVVRVDGQERINAQNIDTKNGGTKTVFDQIALLAEVGDYLVVDVDDLYLLNEQGASRNDFLNDCRVQNILPNGAGNYAQFTPTPTQANYLCVDENPPVDTDYVESNTSGQKDSYAFENLSGPGQIAAVQVHLYGETDDAGVRDVKAMTRQAGVDYLGATKTLNQTAQTYTELWQDNPADSLPWDITDVDNAEFGIQVV